jgi:hypothetical protein
MGVGGRILLGPLVVSAIRRKQRRAPHPAAKLVLLGVGAVALTAVAVKEFPALVREIKIWKM